MTNSPLCNGSAGISKILGEGSTPSGEANYDDPMYRATVEAGYVPLNEYVEYKMIPPKTLTCLCCRNTMPNLLYNVARDLLPSGGIIFESPGHYGTTVFDPMDGTKIVINICDDCLNQGIKDKVIFKYSKETGYKPMT